MKSQAYIMGFLCGLLAVAVAGIIIRRIFKKKFGFCTSEYDERQKAIQGTGYKYAYLTAIITMVIGGIAEMMTGVSWCSLFDLALIGLWISICVFVTYCVIKDAYFSLRSRRKPMMIILLLTGILNLVLGMVNCFYEGGLIENNQLGTNFSNLLTGISCFYLGMMMLCRTIYERRAEENE